MKNIYDDFYIVDYLCQDEESLMPGTVFFNSEYTHNVKIKYAISPDAPRKIIICQLSMSNHNVPKIDEIFIRYFLVHIITWIVTKLTQADATIPQGLRPKNRANNCKTCKQSITPCVPCIQGKFCQICAQRNGNLEDAPVYSADEEKLFEEWLTQ